MTSPLIRVRTEGFRAIGKADIIINGITVVAGENGCGKSTISKLLYNLYKNASDFDSLVSQELEIQLRDVRRFLDILQHEIYSISKDRQLREEIRKELFPFYRNLDKPVIQQKENWLLLIKRISNLFIDQPDLFGEDVDKFSKERSRFRMRSIFNDVLKIKPDSDSVSFTLQMEQLGSFVEAIFEEAIGKIKSRPTELFKKELRNLYSEGELPKKFDVIEFDEEIISLDKSSVSIPYLIQNSIYIDTPMMFGVDSSDIQHWEELNEILAKSGKTSFTNLSNELSRHIIHGDVSINDDSDFGNDFVFKRDDGSIFNLIDCATGVKSFGMLQLLMKNGSLTDKTLLIIDEPESHLHPQWIIEYARLIVLLNKVVGVKFFIASHNPDMVSAIKHISNKEGVIDQVNFYIAEKNEKKYTYNYRHLGSEIDPIFESFNIALERIHTYGS